MPLYIEIYKYKYIYIIAFMFRSSELPLTMSCSEPPCPARAPNEPCLMSLPRGVESPGAPGEMARPWAHRLPCPRQRAQSL